LLRFRNKGTLRGKITLEEIYSEDSAIKLGPIGPEIAMLPYEVEIVAAGVLLLILSATMLRRGLYLKFPVFFIYVALDCLSQIPSLLLLRSSYPAWWWFAWMDNAGDFIFFLAVLGEVCTGIFEEYQSIRRFSKTVIICSVVILVPLSALFGGSSHMANVWAPWTHDWTSPANWLMAFDRCLVFLHLGLALALLLLIRYLHLGWNSFRFGIVLGYGLLVTLYLSDFVLAGKFFHDRLGYAMWVTNAISGSGSCFAILTWIYYALQPEASPAGVPPLQSKELEQWDRTLSRLLGWGTTSL
jgi:hypothetical protein